MSNTTTSDKLVAALLSAATALKINPYEDLAKRTKDDIEAKPVDLANLHSILLKSGPVSIERPCDPWCNGKKVQIFVRTLTGTTKTVLCLLSETVAHVKLLMLECEKITLDQSMLIFAGKHLEDGKRLSDYNITAKSTLHLVIRVRGGGAANWLYLDTKFRSPKFDFDFRDISDDGVVFKRGGFIYGRPIGTIRIALNVIDKFGGNSWLGVKGRASKVSEVAGEWAVSYHGTGMNNARSIAEEGFLLCKGQRFKFGHGIYSTPEIAVALRYADTFTLENERYKFVIQNRVNPETVKRVPASVTGIGEYWISEKNEDIRPYGICFMKC